MLWTSKCRTPHNTQLCKNLVTGCFFWYRISQIILLQAVVAIRDISCAPYTKHPWLFNIRISRNMQLYLATSALWRCWLDGRKGIRPVKNWVVGCWHGYLSWARCRLYGPADATATHRLVSVKSRIGFTILVPAHPVGPGQRERVCVSGNY